MSARMKKYTKLTPPEKADRAFEAEDLREEALRADTIVEGISVRLWFVVEDASRESSRELQYSRGNSF